MFMVDYVTISPDTQRGILGSIPGSFGDFINFVQVVFVGDYSLLFYGYAALLFICAMVLIPQKPIGRFQRYVQQIGKASYHILLFQIFYFSIVYFMISIDASTHHEIPIFPVELGWSSNLFYIPFYLMNLTCCFAGGLLWYKAEKKAGMKGTPWYQHIWMKRTGLLFSALMSFVIMGVSLQLIAEYVILSNYGEYQEPQFFFNQVTGLGFMLSLLSILFWMGLSMACIYKAFSLDDDEFPI